MRYYVCHGDYIAPHFFFRPNPRFHQESSYRSKSCHIYAIYSFRHIDFALENVGFIE